MRASLQQEKGLALWRPILPDALVPRAEAAIAAIYQEFATWYLTSHRVQQLADLALLYTYLDRAEPNEGWTVRAKACLDLSAVAIVRDAARLPIALSGGISGAGWAIEHAASALACRNACVDERIWTHALDTVDARLVCDLERQPWSHACDFLNGLAGLTVYFLERLRRPSSERALRLIVDHLESSPLASLTLTRAEEAGATLAAGGRRSPWVDPEAGIAYGAAGVVGCLGGIIAADIESDRASRLLNRGLDWLESRLGWLTTNRQEDMCPDTQRTADLRTAFAWCTGMLGIASVLHQLGSHLGSRRCSETAAALLDRLLPLSDACVVADAQLCHGACGVAHIFNRVFQSGGDARCQAAAKAWFRRTLMMRTPQAAIGGFPTWTQAPTAQWTPDSSLRNGVIGVAMVLLAGVYPTPPDWDRLFLLSFAR